MKVTVFGATGATGAIGRLVVDDLLQAGHDVVAYVRNPDKVPPHWPTDGVDIVVGSITDPAAVDDAVGRGQVVISALGPDLSRKTTGVPLVEGTRLIVTSMQRHEIQRFIGMATPSVLDPRDRRTLQPRVSTFMARSFLPRAYQEIVAMSKIIMSSDRIWTIIRFLAPRDGAQSGSEEERADYTCGPANRLSPLAGVATAYGSGHGSQVQASTSTDRHRRS
jgi:putative NADH-flavin reductase